MRIALVAACPFPAPQGSQVFVGQMAESLAARGHCVSLLTYGSGEGKSPAGCEHLRLPRLPGDSRVRSGPTLAKPFLDLAMVVALLKLVKNRHVEIVHAHNYEALAVALVARKFSRFKLLYHSHNLMGDELPTYFRRSAARRLATRAGQLVDRQLPRRADHVVALCDYSAGILEQAGVSSERMTVLAPSVEAQEPAADREAARRELGLADGRLVIAYCGNLDAYQDIETAIGGILAYKRSRPAREAVLLLATHQQGRRVESLRERCSESERSLFEVHHCRTYADTRLVVAAADLLVLPRPVGSGYPVKLLNYFASGRPVVSAGCGGKVLVHDKDGLLFADGDALAMAFCIERLEKESGLAERLAAAARDRFEREMTWKNGTPALETVYRRMKNVHTERGSLWPGEKTGRTEKSRLKGRDSPS